MSLKNDAASMRYRQYYRLEWVNDIFRHGNDKEIKRENVDLNENKLEDGDKRRKKNDKARFVYLCYSFNRHGSLMKGLMISITGDVDR